MSKSFQVSASPNFTPGYLPAFTELARQNLAKFQVPVYHPKVSDTPKRSAYSLTKHRRRSLKQGGSGTCWLHQVAQMLNIFANAHRLSDDGDNDAQACRLLIGQAGKALEGGGSMGGGGSPTNALIACTNQAGKGVGVAREDLWPYSDSGSVQRQRPPAGVMEDAKSRWVDTYVDVKPTGLDGIISMVNDDHPVGVAIWWPYAWDDAKTFHGSYFMGTYGHALLITGYALPGVFDDKTWIQLDNWHDDRYPSLPAEQAAKVEGYAPSTGDSTADFWADWAYLGPLITRNYSELISATQIAGYASNLTLADTLAKPW